MRGGWINAVRCLPSVMSSTSPLSPKHWAKRHPPEPEGSSMVYLGVWLLSVTAGSLARVVVGIEIAVNTNGQDARCNGRENGGRLLVIRGRKRGERWPRLAASPCPPSLM